MSREEQTGSSGREAKNLLLTTLPSSLHGCLSVPRTVLMLAGSSAFTAMPVPPWTGHEARTRAAFS
jgi:hypothetical protein